MRKALLFLVMILSISFIFASSADSVEKINNKVDNLKKELQGELKKNGMNYEIAGSFSVDAENIKIEAYVVPNAGEKLIGKLNIIEIRDRNNLENVIRRESSLPKSSVPISSRSLMETIALIVVAVLLGVLLNRIYKKRKEKEAASKKEIENAEEKNAA